MDQAVVVEKPQSEEIGDILRSQFEKVETPTENTVLSGEAPKVETSGQPRAPDGKFAAKEKAVAEAAAVVAAPAVATPAVPAVAATPATPAVPEVPAVVEVKPPVGWKAGPEAWAKLSPEGQSFIAERERVYNEGIQKKYAPAMEFANAMAGEFQPYLGLLQAKGQNPQSATRYLLNAYATLATGSPSQKAQFFAQLAQEHGIDVAGIALNGVPPENPEIVELRNQIAALQRNVTSTVQQHQHAESSQINSAISAFAADPAHKHFEAVRLTMGALLKEGQAKDLQEAYDMAVWTVPEVRASLISQREAQETEKRKAEAEAAQRAAVTLTGAPTASAKALGDMDLRASLEQQFRAAGRV